MPGGSYTSRSRAASNPPSSVGVWRATVTRVDGGQVWVKIPRLSGESNVGPMEALGQPGHNLAAGERVLVAFLEGRLNEPVVLGRFSPDNQTAQPGQGDGGGGGDYLAWAGAWDAGVTYSPNDVVSHAAGLYVALTSNTGVTPSTSLGGDWDLMLQDTNDGGGGGVASGDETSLWMGL